MDRFMYSGKKRWPSLQIFRQSWDFLKFLTTLFIIYEFSKIFHTRIHYFQKCFNWEFFCYGPENHMKFDHIFDVQWLLFGFGVDQVRTANSHVGLSFFQLFIYESIEEYFYFHYRVTFIKGIGTNFSRKRQKTKNQIVIKQVKFNLLKCLQFANL